MILVDQSWATLVLAALIMLVVLGLGILACLLVLLGRKV